MNVKSQIDISVVIPMYNVASYVKECLDSVVVQNNVKFEIICINDGSTDSTLEIIEKYEKKYSNVRVYSQANRGLSATRNKGIELAQGEYIYFLDGDDKLANKNCFCDLMSQMGSYKLDMLEFDASVFFETEDLRINSSSYERMYHRDKSYGYYENGIDLFLKLRSDNKYYCSSCIRLYRREFLLANQLSFCENILYEDNIHTLACYMCAKAVMHVNLTVMLRRVRNNSITQSPLNFKNFLSYVKVNQEIMRLWNLNNNPVLEEELCKICDDNKETIIDIYHKLTIEERNKLDELEPSLRYEIKSLIDNRRTNQDFLFPYHLFFYDDHIMIYGAGKIGKTFYREAKRDKIVNIEGIVDQRGNNASESDVHVDDISIISKNKNYKWLIAIEDRYIADSVKCFLISAGIAEGQIFWDGNMYAKKSASRALIEYNKFGSRFFKENTRRRIFSFAQPEHGNLGDYAVSLGEKLFLDKYFKEYEVIWVTDAEWIAMGALLKQIVTSDDIILMPGGGYFGDLWESWITYKQLLECFPHNIKILLPNTMTYREQNWYDSKSVKNDIQWLKSQNNIFVFWRDIHSFSFFKKYKDLNVYYAPDMALFLEHSITYQNKKDESILLCYRNDREKIASKEHKIKDIVSGCGLKYEEKDIHLNHYLTLEDGYTAVLETIKKMQDYSLVLTDRLHAMIMSYLAHTPCVATDNLTRKLSGVYPWIKLDSIQIIDNVNKINEQLIKQMISKKEEKRQLLDDEFDKLAKMIHKIIDEN